jgi:histone-lysine N-methyltransferase SETMAR
MEDNGMTRATHPPYSPDIAPSDFCLFAYMKYCLRGQSFEAADELFSATEAVFGAIEKSTLDAVFVEWMERLRRWIAANGEYFEEV